MITESALKEFKAESKKWLEDGLGFLTTPIKYVELLELTERLISAEKDAARYRWLRDPSVDVSMVIDKRTVFNPPSDDGITSGYFDYEYRSGSELDDSIDEAMQCNGDNK